MIPKVWCTRISKVSMASTLMGIDPLLRCFFLVALLKANSRIGPIGLARVLSETCYRMVPVAGACAAAGLVMGGITMTGLVGKISHLVNGLTDGQQFLTLLVTAAVTVVLGLGMPTPAAYILAAALMTPILTGIGVDVLTASQGLDLLLPVQI